MPSQTLDCLVVGGGPAGLAAAATLLRLQRRVLVADEGESRLLQTQSPVRLPSESGGMPAGELLGRLRAPVLSMGGEILTVRVTMVVPHVDGGWAAQVDGRRVHARTVLLAIGVVDDEVELPGATAARRRGLLRRCPVWDVHDRPAACIGVVGPSVGDAQAQRDAGFLAHLAGRVLLLGLREGAPRTPWLGDARVRRLGPALVRVRRNGEGLELLLRDGSLHAVDRLYTALGIEPRAALATRLGAARDAQGRLVVDAQGRTSVKGIYAAGDVAHGLGHVVVAQGLGSIAAVAVHDDLGG